MNIYQILETIKSDALRLTPSDFEGEFDFDSKDDEKSFNLIKQCACMYEDIKKDSVEFRPRAMFLGKRTFDIEDLSDDDYSILFALDKELLPLNIRARICDILWVQKHRYHDAIVAANAYYEMFCQLFDPENWIECYEALLRAISISKQINDTRQCNKILEKTNDYVISLDGKDELYLSIKLIDILIDNHFGDCSNYERIIRDIIKRFHDNVQKVESAYELLYCISADKKKTKIELANYFEEQADLSGHDSYHNIYLSLDWYNKARKIYKQNKYPIDDIQRKMLSLQKQLLPEFSQSFKTTIDVTDEIRRIDQIFCNLTFEESVLMLARIASFQNKQQLHDSFKQDMKRNLHQAFANTTIINDEGWTIAELKPVGFNISDEKVIDQHLYNMARRYETITGGLFLARALEIIRATYDLQNESLDFLIIDNPIVPEGRHIIIGKALIAALRGELFEAILILAPQIEHIFRILAKLSGGIIATTYKDGITEAKTLAQIFEISELNEAIDSDIIFTFRGLLCEAAGSNIRNLVAHGLFEERQAAEGDSIYLVCVFIRWLTYTSKQCLDILRNSEKLAVI